MLDPATTAIITGAAGNIVAYMLIGQVDALRACVRRIFRRGTEEQRSLPLCALEDDLVALASQAISEADVRARWSTLLGSYLAHHPEAKTDIETLASTPVVAKTTLIGSQHNHGAGTFIGGDNYGSISSASPGESRW
jgi:hypothetical protein